MSTLLIDAETYSELDVRKVGSYVYANHPSTRVILWSIRDPEWERSLVFDEPNLWTLLALLKQTKQIEWTSNEPLDLIHWSPFDRHIVQYATPPMIVDEPWQPDGADGAILGPNNTFWCDLSTLSAIYGGPAKLSHAADFWGNAESKDEGKHLISRFCSPQKNGTIHTKESDPVRWEQFRAYAGQDTNVMVPMLQRFGDLAENGGEDLHKHWPTLRCVDRMNERGVPIDLASTQLSYDLVLEELDKASVKCKERYGFNPTNAKDIKDYLGLPNCQKETLENYLLDENISKDHRHLIGLRLASAGATTKKLVPMLKRSTVDGRVHDCFKYNGAWTRRLTSSGVQFQNMLRAPSDDAFFEKLPRTRKQSVSADIRLNIRGYIQAPEGTTFVAADYSQIELRVGAWLAGEKWLLDALRKGKDPYLIMASRLYGETITDKGDDRRQFGKIVELASIFGLGRFGLMNQAEPQGIILTEGQAQDAIDTYRQTHKAIVACWDAYQKAFERTMQSGWRSGGSVCIGDVKFERLESAIKVTRPSGFAQYYWLPHYTWSKWPDGNQKTDITYLGRGKSGKMEPRTTYGGDIFQGVVQGTAADLMLEGMLAAENEGFPPVMSVHDEVVCEVVTPESLVEDLCDVFNILPEWAKGLPVASEGWQQRRFTK